MFATGPDTQGKPVWPEDMTYLKYIMSAFYRSVCGRCCAGGTRERTQIQEALKEDQGGGEEAS